MSDSIPMDRTIAALEEVWASIADLLDGLPDEQWSAPSPLPGWDVQDNVAHVLGTESMLLGLPGPDVDIDRDEHSHVRSDVGVFNEVWVEEMRGTAPDDMRERFADLTGRRLAALRAMSQEEWDAEGFTPAGRNAYGRFMQIRVFDCWFHEQDIRDAVGRPGNEWGLAVEVTLDELTTAMGYVVGKKAGVPAGRSVVFALTDGGVVVREIHVEVGDRATVVDRLSAPASATLTMPIGVMTRLAGGRVDVGEVRDRISVDGDAALVDSVLAHLNYTI